MRKLALIGGGGAVLLIGLLTVSGIVQKSKSRQALDAYIAELKAKGESLTWEDMNFPPPGATNISVTPLEIGVGKLGRARPNPAELELMSLVTPGFAEIGWMAPRPIVIQSSRRGQAAHTWAELSSDMRAASNALAEIRDFLQEPPTYFPWNLTNPLAMTPRPPFVAMRTAAQWLAADTVTALQEHDLVRTESDLHGLTQQAAMYRDDITLVGAMIRVAISGLGLNATWEALQADGWSDDSLKQLQEDWEAIDFLSSVERGFMGERASVLYIFSQPNQVGQYVQTLNSIMTTKGQQRPLAALIDYVRDRTAVMYWRAHREEDELFYLKEKQKFIDLIRQLKTNAPSVEVVHALRLQNQNMQAELQGTLAGARHLLTLIALGNFSRAIETTMRIEMQRRMTIIAIALERYHLKTGVFPDDLEALAPDYIEFVPLDPMSGQPFRYVRTKDMSFTLYSVGEDGADDQADPSMPSASGSLDLWSGRDAVWPRGCTTYSSPD